MCIAVRSEQITRSTLPILGILFDFFNSETNVEQLVQFLSLEEKKGKDKFNAIRFTLFKVSDRWVRFRSKSY